MCVCVCVRIHVCVYVCVCMHVCVCSQASHSQAMDLFVFKQQVLFRVDFLSVTLDRRVKCPRVELAVKI